MIKTSIPNSNKTIRRRGGITRRPWPEFLEQVVSEAPTGLLLCELIRRKHQELEMLDDALALLDRESPNECSHSQNLHSDN